MKINTKRNSENQREDRLLYTLPTPSYQTKFRYVGCTLLISVITFRISLIVVPHVRVALGEVSLAYVDKIVGE